MRLDLRWIPWSLLLAAFVLPHASAHAQLKPFPATDPYTKHAPEAISAAGYASLGPFRFGDDHTTQQIEQTLKGVPLLWVETDHFKLGSGLPEYTLGDDEEKERVRAELERLALRLPSVKPRTKKLDPWLRLHLQAQRLEELYAQFLQAFDVAEGEFPTTPPDPETRSSSAYMGEGRYLGMSSKFTVLLFDRKSALARYGSVYLGGSLEGATRRHLPVVDALLFVTAAECLEGNHENDSALACVVVSGVTHNLAAGFRGSRVPLAFAVSEGIAHWFSRQVDPRYHIFSGLEQTEVRGAVEGNWAPGVRARVEHGIFPSTADMLAWSHAGPLEWAEHLVLWSRMDYLLAREDGAAGRLLRRLKEPPALTEPPVAKNGELTSEELLERTRAAFGETTGGDLARFDQLWSEWVLKTYPKK